MNSDMSQFIKSIRSSEQANERTLANMHAAMRDYKLADYQYDVLVKAISEFQDGLNIDEEVAVQLSSFGQNIVVYVTTLGYSNPSLIHFYGYLPNGSKVELIQHINQLNFLLLAQKKSDPNAPAHRIGFQLPSESV